MKNFNPIRLIAFCLAFVLVVIPAPRAAEEKYIPQEAQPVRAQPVAAAAPQPANFTAWKRDFAQRARAAGIAPSVVDTFMREARYLPRVVELDRAQPESRKTFLEYYGSAVSQTRITNGRNNYRLYARELENAANRYGVPAQIITALWGMETSYGGYTGDMPVLSTLSTLAYDGRRGAFFSGELLAAMRILQEGHIEEEEFTGSWAGAMGQCQFMPTSFQRLAVDGNGDGRRDIWTTREDVFASAANYLSQSGWRRDLPWGTRATMSRDLARVLEGTDKQSRTLEEWRRLGVTPDGPLRVLPTTPLWLVVPDCANAAQTCAVGASYLVTSNFKVIKSWNNSDFFAASVGRLSDEISMVASGYTTPTPSSTPTAENRPNRMPVYNQ